ncbi:MAG: hypothetical protein A4E53_00248 [Pelotomaculum sp. PtaB.Bin104]|nr:MAG: hypothetical protein A4E53_00248 [Pelotomaculum sp. PtaB.Bin104]
MVIFLEGGSPFLVDHETQLIGEICLGIYAGQLPLSFSEKRPSGPQPFEDIVEPG